MTRNFYNLPPSWNPGFEIPDYVMAEPPGRGVFVTSWLPRGTISQVIPDFAPVERARKVGALGSLGDDTLGAQQTFQALNANGDPIAGYGQKAASWIMHSIQRVPQDQRPAALQALFNAIDPGLWRAVEGKAKDLRAQGLDAKAALQQAIAQSMTQGMVRELKQTGERWLRGDRRPVRPEGQLGLGVYPDQRPRAEVYALQALGFSIGDLNPLKYIKKGAVEAAGALNSAVGKPVASALSAAGSFVRQGVNMLGSLACSVASNPAAGLAATAAAGPAAGAGVSAASGMCGNKATAEMAPPPPPPPPASSVPKWLLPAGIAAGAVVIGALVIRK